MIKASRTLRYLALAVLAVGLGVGGVVFFHKDSQDPLEKYFTVKAERGNIRRVVTSTGTLQAVVTVQVGSQVSGRIQELHADFNSVVKRGQVLAVIDPANFEAQRQRSQAALSIAEAAVKNAEANWVNRKAELASSKANLEVSRVARRDAEIQLKRSQGLMKDGLISDRDLENAQVTLDQNVARYHQAEAQVSQSEASINSALSQKDQAAANVKQAKADLQIAEVNLEYTRIISPIDGVVVERNVDIGQTVAASFQAPVLFLIANDLTKMQVIAQVDEADIGALSEMADSQFSVDAFPGQSFQGKISEIRLSSKLPGSSTSSSSTGSTGGSSSGASNVVVYNVILDVDNPQLKLRPGMTANVNFTVASADNVLKIPNAALRYRPPDAKPEEIQKVLASFPNTVSADTHQTERIKPRPEVTSGRNGHVASGDGVFRSRNGKMLARQSSGAEAVVKPSTSDRYGINAGLTIHFPKAEELRPNWSMIWTVNSDGEPQPRRVKLGITDGRETAVLDGDLKEGQTIITGELNNTEGAPQQTTSPFRGPFGRPAGSAGSRRSGR